MGQTLTRAERRSQFKLYVIYDIELVAIGFRVGHLDM